MDQNIQLRKGLDLNIAGEADSSVEARWNGPKRIAIVPDDFPGFTPKLDVKEGDSVRRGQSLMHDKNDERIRLASPATGIIESVVRGERRKIERVVVAVSEEDAVVTHIVTPDNADSIREAMMASGLWAMMRQRPYDIVPSPATTPRDIFITTFDSAPLAPSLTAQIKDMEAEIEAGLKALMLLTTGKVYVSMRSNDTVKVPAGVVSVGVSGPHPAGNAGIQAANIRPVNKGEAVWTLDIVTVARIGTLILKGTFDGHTVVAVTGSDIIHPELVKTLIGADLSSLLHDNIKKNDHHHRIISGNVLTGVHTDIEDFLRFPYRHITVIPEGDDVNEFMGWASMATDKMSVSRSFPSHFLFGKKFKPDARLHGGRRAMIMSGAYDKVLPMDILPEYLIKAIIARDIDRMESLGIYEIAPEDVALCEYVDPSKLELQKIVREGLDYLRKELD